MMISPADVSILDLNSEYLGIEVSDLMGSAGSALADEILRRYDGKGTIAVVVGPGNNGGDSCVAARHLFKNGTEVKVILSFSPSKTRSQLAEKAYDDLPDEVSVHVMKSRDAEEEIRKELNGCAVIVDGLLGAGSSGAPRGKFAGMIRAMNSANALKVAVDSPTGLGYDDCFRADVTVTFHDVKEGMMIESKPLPECGEISVKNIGIPIEASVQVGPGDLLRYPKKAGYSKKGEVGRVLIIGGGPFIGAPVLSAMGASRAGADLIRLAVPGGIADAVSTFSTDLIVERLDTLDPYSLGPEVQKEIGELLDWSHCVLLGPGAGRSRSALYTLRSLFDLAVEKGKKIVVDADGLTALSEIGEPIRCSGSDVLLTPHRGELKRIIDAWYGGFDNYRPPEAQVHGIVKWEQGPIDLVSKLVHDTGAVVLGKGPVDLIATGADHSLADHISVSSSSGKLLVRYNRTGVPQMSVGGTGDILSGLCAGLMSLGMDPFDSGCLGSFICGEAGERTFSEIGHSLSASEMLKRIRILSP
ncbi:MAG: NAD(P)H-hydrate dehydratase [Candidatus Thermoplasmatota archaeon]|nr:NAD(P)H-hydrate dehydratase [Candidatus Thermoplasmatota archaeon]